MNFIKDDERKNDSISGFFKSVLDEYCSCRMGSKIVVYGQDEYTGRKIAERLCCDFNKRGLETDISFVRDTPPDLEDPKVYFIDSHFVGRLLGF